MATIYKKKVNGKLQSPYYYAVYYSADRKRVSKSTGLTKKREAQRLATEWEQEQIKLRKKQYQSNADLADTLASAFTKLNKDNFTLDDFNEFLAKGYEISKGEEAHSPTLRRWISEWMTNKALHIKESTFGSYKRHIKGLFKVMDDVTEKRLAYLTATDIERIQHRLISQARENGTRNRSINYKMGLLKSAITEAYNKGKIHRNVGLAVKDLPEDDSSTKAPFTPEEINKLTQVAPEGWKGAILFASKTGLRIKNLVELKWKDLDIANREMTVIPVKQRRIKKQKAQTYPITEEMMNYLNFIGIKQKGLVFPDVASMHETSRPKKFDRIMRDAGVPKKVELPDRQIGVRSFHSLRHSFNTFLARGGISQEVRMQITGHASEAVNDMYTHFDTEMIRNAVQQGIPEIKWQNAP